MSDKAPSLVIFSRNPQTRNELVSELDHLRVEFPNLQIISFDMSFTSTINDSAQTVILDLEQWVPSDELAINDLRGYGYEGPIIVLSTKFDEASGASYVNDRIVFVDRGKDPKQLNGIAKRLVLGSIVAARKHPRHTTNENGEMQIEGQVHFYPCHVKNMSKGGAYLEFERSVHVRIGDKVVVKIHLIQLGRVHTVKGRVAWINQRGVGIEFAAV